MDVRPIPFVPDPPRHGHAPVIARIEGLARALRERSGASPRRGRQRRDDALPWLDFVPRLRDYPWRESR